MLTGSPAGWRTVVSVQRTSGNGASRLGMAPYIRLQLPCVPTTLVNVAVVCVPNDPLLRLTRALSPSLVPGILDPHLPAFAYLPPCPINPFVGACTSAAFGTSQLRISVLFRKVGRTYSCLKFRTSGLAQSSHTLTSSLSSFFFWFFNYKVDITYAIYVHLYRLQSIIIIDTQLHHSRTRTLLIWLQYLVCFQSHPLPPLSHKRIQNMFIHVCIHLEINRSFQMVGNLEHVQK